MLSFFVECFILDFIYIYIYEGYQESNLRFGIKKTQVKRNIFYYLNLKATILNYFST